jgi:hypothetical protein
MTGTPIRKTDPHQKRSRSIPPSTGPAVPPPMMQLRKTAKAKERCRSFRNMARISARPGGISVAPAIPSSARQAMSMSGPVEKAASTESAPNAAAPVSSSLRLPTRSPSVPIVMRKPESTNP